MKLNLKIGLILCAISLSCSYSRNTLITSDNGEWTKYELDDLAVLADIPSHLTPMLSESLCFFRSDDKPFESLRIERYYLNPKGREEFLKNRNNGFASYYEIKLDSVTIYVKSEALENEDQRPSLWAYFSTANYEFQMAYTGPNSERFDKFLRSIVVDYDKLTTQFEQNKNEPDYSNLNFDWKIDLGDKHYLISRSKNECKINLPVSDSIHFIVSCSGAVLQKLDDENWIIFPSRQVDSVKISLQTSLPENRIHTFDEKWIPVKIE